MPRSPTTMPRACSAVLLWVASCSASIDLDEYTFMDCTPGTERCVCNTLGHCQDGLQCRVPGICVDPTASTGTSPDAACFGAYVPASDACRRCACSPDANMGCYEAYAACVGSADDAFSSLCEAVLRCSLEQSCVGAHCDVACASEREAAAQYGNGSAAACTDDPSTSPCAAADAVEGCALERCQEACF